MELLVHCGSRLVVVAVVQLVASSPVAGTKLADTVAGTFEVVVAEALVHIVPSFLVDQFVADCGTVVAERLVVAFVVIDVVQLVPS